MITQELLTFIRSNLAQGKTREDIKKTLIAGGGWTEFDIDEALRVIGVGAQPVPQAPAPSVSAQMPPMYKAPPAVAQPMASVSRPVKFNFFRNPKSSTSFWILLGVSTIGSLLLFITGTLTGYKFQAQGIMMLGLMAAVLLFVLFTGSVILNFTTRILKVENRSLAKSIVFTSSSLLAACFLGLLSAFKIPALITSIIGLLVPILLFGFIYQVKFLKSIGVLIVNLIFSAIIFGIIIGSLFFAGFGFLKYYLSYDSNPAVTSLNNPVQAPVEESQPTSTDNSQAGKIEQVKAQFPAGFPFPDDSQIQKVEITNDLSPSYGLTYTISGTASSLETKYESFLKKYGYTGDSFTVLDSTILHTILPDTQLKKDQTYIIDVTINTPSNQPENIIFRAIKRGS